MNYTHTPHHSNTRANQPTPTTALETPTKFASAPGQGTFSTWLSNVAYQRAGYAQAGAAGRVKACGTVPVLSGRVALGVVGKSVAVMGLHRCGSRWCAECQAKVASHKAEEVKQAMTWGFDNGLIPVMYTVTGAHTTTAELDRAGGNLHEAVQGVDVHTVRKRMSKAWAHTRNGRRGAALRSKRVGMITAQEVTLDDVMFPGSRTGIHWHRHVLVLLHPVCGQSPQVTADEYGRELFDLWQAGCAKVDLKADPQAFDIQVATSRESALELGKYVAKYEGESITGYVWQTTETVHTVQVEGTLHKELTRGDVKNAGKSRVSPEQLLRNIGYLLEHAPTNHLRLNQMIAQWKDLERGAKGVHWLQWSPGLRDLVGLNEELSDEEIAQAETTVDDDTVAVVTWDELKQHVDELRRVVRESADGEEFSTLLLCLDSWGLPYTLQPQQAWQASIAQRMRCHGTKQR